MSIEGEPGSPRKQPRFTLVKCMIGIGFFANQGLYGTSEAVAAHMIDAPELQHMGLTKAGIGFAIAAAGIWYAKKNYYNPQSEQIEIASENNAEIITLPPPIEDENPTEEAA